MREVTDRERLLRTRQMIREENPVTLDDMSLAPFSDQLDKLSRIEFRKDGGAHPFGDGVCRLPGVRGLR